MKKLKLLLILSLMFSLTGCFKKDNFEDANIYVSVYPIEYIVNYLYGNYSTISSIYPDGVDTDKYKLTNKQIKDYSETDLYVFNGMSEKENEYVTSMFKYNKNLKIIDATQTMEYTYHENELWYDPSNFLMLALNVKNGILEYTTNHTLNKTIEENYQNLKIEISKIDANLKLLYENSNTKTIVVDSNTYKFLEKYGFTVISLEEDESLNDKVINDVNDLIDSGEIKYIFSNNKNNLNDTVSKIVKNSNVEVLEFKNLTNLTDEERSNKEDYISLLNDNIDLLKNELYK